jgi:hypothetical protein
LSRRGFYCPKDKEAEMPKKVRRVDMTHLDAELLADPEPFGLELYSEPEQSVTKARWTVRGLLDSIEVDATPKGVKRC